MTRFSPRGLTIQTEFVSHPSSGRRSVRARTRGTACPRMQVTVSYDHALSPEGNRDEAMRILAERIDARCKASYTAA